MNLSVDRAGEDAGGGLGGSWRPRWLSRDLLCLFAARALRSFAIGYIAIILPIYITELGYNPVHLGMLFSISGFTSAVLAISIGVLADRFGRKPFIILIALMMAAGSVVLPLAHNFAVIVAAAAFGTIGFPGGAGGGGGWGPYYPAAQSLVAEQAEYEHRTTIFSVLSFVGVIAGSLGSLASALPRLLSTTAKVPMLTGFRLLLLLTAPIGILMALVVIPVREIRYPRMLGQAPDPDSQMSRAAVNVEIIEVRKRFGLSPKSWRLVWRFMVTNMVNGIAMGMMGPFVVYWFYKRFGVSAADLGHLYFMINICAALPYLAVGRVARRFGAVVTITVSRGISAIMLIVVILMPTYSLAATVYLLRVLVAVFAVPVRQSFLMGVIDPAERSSAAGFAATPSQASQSISAYAAGILIHYVALSMPLVGAAVFQGLNALLYFAFFRDVRPPEELNVLPAADEQEQVAQTVTDAKARR